MLNVLSFFFILIELANQQFDICFDAQRFELFLYHSSLGCYVMNAGNGFRCSTFWAFSLSPQTMGSAITYYKRFRCSRFWAFSLFITRMEKTTYASFDAQFSELFLYKDWSLLMILDMKKVSMLNVLSFFFILG